MQKVILSPVIASRCFYRIQCASPCILHAHIIESRKAVGGHFSLGLGMCNRQRLTASKNIIDFIPLHYAQFLLLHQNCTSSPEKQWITNWDTLFFVSFWRILASEYIFNRKMEELMYWKCSQTLGKILVCIFGMYCLLFVPLVFSSWIKALYFHFSIQNSTVNYLHQMQMFLKLTIEKIMRCFAVLGLGQIENASFRNALAGPFFFFLFTCVHVACEILSYLTRLIFPKNTLKMTWILRWSDWINPNVPVYSFVYDWQI